MNVFVLSTGRCGSTTFARACSHMTNFGAAHESRSHLLGAEHFEYPHNHIEVDNRLSWFLGMLARYYGDDAYYVYLRRNREATARSFVERWDWDVSIVRAYGEQILTRRRIGVEERYNIALDLVDTVDANIQEFLVDKTKKVEIWMENPVASFLTFWDDIGAKGDRDAAVGEWAVMHNRSKGTLFSGHKAIRRLRNRLKRLRNI